MSVVYVIAATKAEAAPVERLIGLPAKSSPGEMRTGRAGPNQLAIFIAGMGPNRARSAALAAFDRQNMKRPKGSVVGPPDAAIVIGLCGGLVRPLDDMLKQVYASGWRGRSEVIKEILRQCPELPRHVIWKRASRLGLTQKRQENVEKTQHGRWSADEDKLLLQLCGEYPARLIGETETAECKLWSV